MRASIPALALLLLTATACGTATDGPTGDGADAAASPERIVSLSPTSTEVLFAIGAGDRVVAVDDQSSYPPEAPMTDLSGFQPNVEAITAYDPDLVVVSGDPGGLVDSLTALDIEVLVQPAATTLGDVYEQILSMGELTGDAEAAEVLVEQMRTDIEAIVSSIDLPDRALTYYHELDPTFYSVTSRTFIGELYGLFGMTSIADAADGQDSGYPQLSPEYIIEADPDLILLADVQCCGVDIEQVNSRPGWQTMTAVANGAIVELDADTASRWGPRIVDFLRLIADGLTSVSATTQS